MFVKKCVCVLNLIISICKLIFLIMAFLTYMIKISIGDMKSSVELFILVCIFVSISVNMAISFELLFNGNYLTQYILASKRLIILLFVSICYLIYCIIVIRENNWLDTGIIIFWVVDVLYYFIIRRVIKVERQVTIIHI